MPQTYYTRPYSLKWLFITVAILVVLFLVLFFVLGSSHPASYVFLALAITISLVATVLDLETAYATTTTLDDGRVVRVKRPLVGLRRCECKVGLTGGYEVRVDGWRYEEALIRI